MLGEDLPVSPFEMTRTRRRDRTICLQDKRKHDLIVILDDATSEIYYAQLAPEETTATVMMGLRAVIEQKGLFCSIYSDRGAHFWPTPKSGGKVDCERPTQVGRAMKELGVHMTPAYSPQARGRSERNFSTWQGRPPQELRLRGIGTLDGANEFLREHYIAEFNRHFTVPAAKRGTAFISCRHRNLEMVFTRFKRTVDQDNSVRFTTWWCSWSALTGAALWPDISRRVDPILPLGVECRFDCEVPRRHRIGLPVTGGMAGCDMKGLCLSNKPRRVTVAYPQP
jgi:hypothetical protein